MTGKGGGGGKQILSITNEHMFKKKFQRVGEGFLPEEKKLVISGNKFPLKIRQGKLSNET